MKADLVRREPEMLTLWEKEGLYERIRRKSLGRKKYILHDGPPYANGHIHIGHALNKILKDIIVKYKNLKGFDAYYLPGWDCHGLPIEHQCLKDMGKRKEEVERVAFRKQARKYAEKYVAIQREEFKRLGIFGDWGHPYLTMSYDYQASIAESFLKLFEKGYIEQRLKPVPWCYDCETALADAELEYEDVQDTAVYVAFPKIHTGPDIGKGPAWTKGDFSFLVWTTTPWTLPANVGLAFHPQLEYVLASTNRGKFVFAEALLESLSSKLGFTGVEVLAKEKGSFFQSWIARHPFLEAQVSKVILAEYVSAVEGTGIVHIAPGHGEEDYQFGHLQNGLEILSPVDMKGRFTMDFKLCEGMPVMKANPIIIQELEERKALLHQERYQHSYPHCWRCKKPIIFRATKQWFMKIDHQDLRKKMLEAIRTKIDFTPDWGKNRIGSMVETRPEWCLSRQRYWGVPIPILWCESCGHIFITESKETIIRLFREKGSDIWFEADALTFLNGRKPSCCKDPRLVKETDIIDVWFDSGVSHQAVLKRNAALDYPCELYLEGSDQHRGWFQSALTTGMALDNLSPFKGVLTHGFVVDGEGRKMSKSAGNVIAPQDVMKEFGSDILRLWVSSCDYQFDVRLSHKILVQLADSYRKIRNTFRYMLANLYDFDPAKNGIRFEDLRILDQWVMFKVDTLAAAVDEDYRRFNFHQIYRRIHEFCSNELSSYYFDILKDILYTAAKNSHLRRSAQTAMFHILKKLVKMTAPIIPFTADEVWRSFAIETGIPSVHESQWDDTTYPYAIDRMADWEDIRAVRDTVMPVLEKLRESKAIGSSLDAKIYLETADSSLGRVLRDHLAELPRVFIVSQVYWTEENRPGSEEIICVRPSSREEIKIRIAVEKADGGKCVRCWNYSLFVGTDAEHPQLCQKCVEAIRT
ncbi:MAG: isoleucine--tRNA ligase [Candidatus Omnitrophica bacterium]|nr:isoleucine--tRNA ligase [Candidatus Omnitrophota bacterium]